jgi:hypothetical protein
VPRRSLHYISDVIATLELLLRVQADFNGLEQIPEFYNSSNGQWSFQKCDSFFLPLKPVLKATSLVYQTRFRAHGYGKRRAQGFLVLVFALLGTARGCFVYRRW